MAVRILMRNIPRITSPSLQARYYCAPASEARPVLTLFTKENCQLCDEALEQLGPYLRNVKLELIDIEEDGREADYDKFRYEIPVFFFNKKFLCKNRIDLEKFHEAVAAHRREV